MKNVIDQILDENNSELISIKGNNGEIFKFEQVALIPIDDDLYTILHPIADDVLSDDVLVFKIVRKNNEAELVLEENEDLINEIFDEYYSLYSKRKK